MRPAHRVSLCTHAAQTHAHITHAAGAGGRAPPAATCTPQPWPRVRAGGAGARGRGGAGRAALEAEPRGRRLSHGPAAPRARVPLRSPSPRDARGGRGAVRPGGAMRLLDGWVRLLAALALPAPGAQVGARGRAGALRSELRAGRGRGPARGMLQLPASPSAPAAAPRRAGCPARSTGGYWGQEQDCGLCRSSSEHPPGWSILQLVQLKGGGKAGFAPEIPSSEHRMPFAEWP